MPKLAFSLQTGPVTRLERLSIKSLVELGYDYRLYSYERDVFRQHAIPFPAKYVNAREILDVPVDTQQQPGFPSLFQYTALARHGGLWVGTDYVLLRELPDTPWLAASSDTRIFPGLLRLPEGFRTSPGILRLAARPRLLASPRAGPVLARVLRREWPAEFPLLDVKQVCPVGSGGIGHVFEANGYCPDDPLLPGAYGACLWRKNWPADNPPGGRYSPRSLYELLWSNYFD